MLNKLPTNCPTCKARVVSIRFGVEHVNGHTEESTEYDCGCRMHYIPSWEGHENSIETTMPCNLDPLVTVHTAILEIEISITTAKPITPSVVSFMFHNMDFKPSMNETLYDSAARNTICNISGAYFKKLVSVKSVGRTKR